MKISKEFQVGLFMVIAIAVLYLGFNYLSGIEFFEKTNKFYAKYNNVGGLTVSNPVTISGYSVGRVSKVFIDQADSNRVVVEMTIQGDILLGKDSEAVLDVGLLGETAIKINPGNISNPTQPGDTLYSKLGAGIFDILGDAGTTIESTINRVNIILDKLTGSGDQINNMVDNLEQMTVNMKRLPLVIENDLNKVVADYSTVINTLDETVKQLKPVITKYGQLADSLKEIDIKPTILAAEKTLTDLDSLIVRIDKSDGSLNRLIEDKDLYENINTTMMSLDSLLIHMRSRPKDFFAPLGRDKPKGIRK